MSDIWYYALDDKEVGPLPLADLTAILARTSNPKDMLVWRAGFEKWQRAATVPELAAFIIKPPPPPPQPASSLPPILAHDRLIASAGIVQSSDTSRSKTWIAVVVIATVVAGAAGVRFLSKTNSGSATPEPDPSRIISGKTRDSLVTSGMGPCLTKQKNDPDAKALSLPKAALEKYCSCYMNALADTVTYGDLKNTATPGTFTPSMQKKIDDAAASCQDKLRRSLLGADK
jgi:hypothetical protein